jgi:hypothetical protein
MICYKYLDKFYNKDDVPWVSLTWTKFYANTQNVFLIEEILSSFGQGLGQGRQRKKNTPNSSHFSKTKMLHPVPFGTRT